MIKPLHQMLAQLLWIVRSNPAELVRIPASKLVSNTLFARGTRITSYTLSAFDEIAVVDLGMGEEVREEERVLDRLTRHCALVRYAAVGRVARDDDATVDKRRDDGTTWCRAHLLGLSMQLSIF